MKKWVSIYKEAKITREETYWISPKGEVMPFSSFDRHMGKIIEKPEIFGYTIKEVEKIFLKYGEDLDQEGKAREEIIKNLLKKGWIRIRRYNRPDRWTVNIPNLSKKIKDILQYWATQMIKSGWSKYEDVLLDSPRGREQHTMGEIASDILYLSEERFLPKERSISCSFLGVLL